MEEKEINDSFIKSHDILRELYFAYLLFKEVKDDGVINPKELNDEETRQLLVGKVILNFLERKKIVTKIEPVFLDEIYKQLLEVGEEIEDRKIQEAVYDFARYILQKWGEMIGKKESISINDSDFIKLTAVFEKFKKDKDVVFGKFPKFVEVLGKYLKGLQGKRSY